MDSESNEFRDAFDEWLAVSSEEDILRSSRVDKDERQHEPVDQSGPDDGKINIFNNRFYEVSQLPIETLFNGKAKEFQFNADLIHHDVEKECRETEAMNLYYNIIQHTTQGYGDSDVCRLTVKCGHCQHRTPVLTIKELKEVAFGDLYFDYVRDRSAGGFYVKLSIYTSTGVVYPSQRKMVESDDEDDEDLMVFRLNTPVFNSQEMIESTDEDDEDMPVFRLNPPAINSQDLFDTPDVYIID